MQFPGMRFMPEIVQLPIETQKLYLPVKKTVKKNKNSDRLIIIFKMKEELQP